MPGEFDLAFNESDILVLETDIEQIIDPGIIQKLVTQTMLPGDETLRTVLDKRVFKELEAKCEEYSIPIDSILKFKPAMAVNALGTLQTRGLGFMRQGADLYYFSKAKEEAKALDFLESLDFQVDLILNIGTGYENEYVRYSLADWEESEKNLLSLIGEWKSGASGKLESELAKMKKKFPQVYKTMFSDRNNSWLPLIEAYLTTEAVEFVIAGLGHLYGPDGLLEQLKNREYQIEQLP
jgi:uncharacterized protein YbaP (TraB family)